MERCIRIYRSGIHFGEEPRIFGNSRSGMIQLSGCHLSCSFCYTPETSKERLGRDFTNIELLSLIQSLIERGAQNLNLISPSHEWPRLRPVFERLSLAPFQAPVLFKVSGYEGAKLVRSMSQYCDVWVPDFKFWYGSSASHFNLPDHYGRVAERAIETMLETHRTPWFDRYGTLTRGIVVRHLLIPGYEQDAREVIRILARMGFQGYLNLMTFFIDPITRSLRKVSNNDLDAIVDLARELGLSVWINGKAKATPQKIAPIQQETMAIGGTL